MLTINNGEGFKETISLLNNFVHPYNSSNNIKLNYGGEYKIGITINKAYSNEEITKIIYRETKDLNGVVKILESYEN